MKSFAPAEFWRYYDRLPKPVQELANKNFQIFQRNPFHPSLQFKEIKRGIWSVRVGRHYRSLAKRRPDCWIWFWIGTHEDYNKLVKRLD